MTNSQMTKLESALQLMKQRSLDGLIIYSDGLRNMLMPSYLQYFAEFRPLGPNNALVISKDGRARLLVEPEWDLTRVSNNSWVKDIKGTTNFKEEMSDLLHELNVTKSLGVIGSSEMTEDVYLRIKREAKIEIADDIIEEMTKSRTKKEVEIARKTARIADVGFQAFLKYIQVGIREYELAAEIDFAMRMAGSEDNFILLSSEKHNYAMHPPRDKRLTQGDIIIGEITPVCEGQFIQLCRTVVLGKPNPVLMQKYDILISALKASMNTIKPGVPAALISRNMNKIISDAGYGKYCRPPYMRARGHGLAVGTVAPGAAIDDNTELNLRSQQVIIVHPNQYIPETGYLACGETILVTDDGIERLSDSETKLYTKEA